MTKSLSLLVLIGSVYLLDACGGSSGSPPATHFSVMSPASAVAGSADSRGAPGSGAVSAIAARISSARTLLRSLSRSIRPRSRI